MQQKKMHNNCKAQRAERQHTFTKQTTSTSLDQGRNLPKYYQTSTLENYTLAFLFIKLKLYAINIVLIKKKMKQQ